MFECWVTNTYAHKIIYVKRKDVVFWMNFLDLNGLSCFLNKIKELFAPISHSHLKADITDLVDTTEDFLQVVYPIGSIYISTVITNPSDLFGFGSWEQIKDTFLLAAGDAYNAGAIGGEATHILTVDEMPSHNHNASTANAGGHTHQIGTDKDTNYISSGQYWSVHNASTGAAYMNGTTSWSGDHSHTVTINEVGGGLEHNKCHHI